MRSSNRFAMLSGALLLGLASASAAFAQSGTAQNTTIKGFAVDQQGNLGVGTSDPQHTLHVAGNTYTQGVLMGGGINGQFGSSAVISGQDVRYGQRTFVFTYAGTGNAPTDIQIHAINPVDSTQSVFKTFIIDHPLDEARHLVHAALEGPEGAVFYRGSAQLRDGRARIELPPYFEALTRAEGRTLQLTNVDGFDRLAIETQDGLKIADGAFRVISDNPTSNQRFDWEVKAVRADGPLLVVEPLKGSMRVAGYGPYTYRAAAAPLSGQVR